MKSDSEEKVTLLQRDFFHLFLQFAESAATTAASSNSALLDQIRSIVHGSSFDKRGSLSVDDDEDDLGIHLLILYVIEKNYQNPKIQKEFMIN